MREITDAITLLHPMLRIYYSDNYLDYFYVAYLPDNIPQSFLEYRPFGIGIVYDSEFEFNLLRFISIIKFCDSLLYYNSEKDIRVARFPGFSLCLFNKEGKLKRFRTSEIKKEFDSLLRLTNVETSQIKKEERISFRKYFD